MSITSNIRKILFIGLWCLAGTGLVLLLLAASRSRSESTCQGIEITINGEEQGQWFIDKSDIIRVLTENNSIGLKNRNLKSFDLKKTESRLKEEVWIRNAELFFDNNGILKVKVTERNPVARIFSSSGGSFYIDSALHRLPLSDRMSAKLPVFTGFPLGTKAWKSDADKQFVRGITQLSMYIMAHPFWMAQVSQINITPSREFELVPTVGNHLVEFGDGEDCDAKFNRLMIFYKQVLSKAGMNKYERIKIQYNNEVVGVKK